jgi:lipoprotein-anchoring transpeptidase ErfK/SrfK
VRRALRTFRRLVIVFAAAGVVCAAAPATDLPPVVQAGVTVAGVEVGGMGSEPTRRTLERHFTRPLRFTDGKKEWQISPTELGAADVDDAVTAALRAGANEDVELAINVRVPAVRGYARFLARRYHVAPQDARLVGLAGLAPSFSPAKTGRRLEQKPLVKAMTHALRTGQRKPIALQFTTLQPALTPADFGAIVVIRRESNRLTLFNGPNAVATFGVATGTRKYPTPLGRFEIVDMQRNPWWRPPNSEWARGAKPIPPGPGNPLGTRWMGISVPAVGIHGTPDAASIGYSASHGCIRMKIPEAEWLFQRVTWGTPVFIVSA